MATDPRQTGRDDALDRATSSLGEDDGLARGTGGAPREGETDPPRAISGLAASVQPGGAPDEPGAIVADEAVTGDETSGGVGAGPAGSREGASLRDHSADQIRNIQRGGLDVARPDAPEGNDTLNKVWSDPGGEAYNYRNALVGAGGKADNHTDEVEAETPAETVRHLSDATLSPDDKDATAEAIARMGEAGAAKR